MLEAYGIEVLTIFDFSNVKRKSFKNVPMSDNTGGLSIKFFTLIRGGYFSCSLKKNIIKKIITIFALVAAFTTLSMTTKKMTPNIPMYHETLGEIPPIDILPNFSPTVWTIFNNSNCNLFQIEVFVTLEESPTVFSNFGNPISVMPSGQFQVSGNFVRSFTGKSFSDGLTITNISFRLGLGAGYAYDVYPGDSKTISTGLPFPCDCIHVEVDATTKTLIINNGVGC